MKKIELLQTLANKVAQCTKCQELAETRTQTVFCSGNPNSKIVFIGEAPGADEDEQGEVFVGAAGQLLASILKSYNISREDVYFCNILKCRPPNNRTPTPEEANNCRPYLDLQLQLINPQIIVCLGVTATNYLLCVNQPITHMRGRWFKYQNKHVNADVLCTFHPSYLLHRDDDKSKQQIIEDFDILMEYIKK